MKSRKIQTLLLPPLLTLAAAVSASSQNAVPQPAGLARGPVAEAQGGRLLDPTVRARARYLAASTADEALRWSDPLAAVRVLAGAADLLWADSPGRAAAWLTRAWELAGEVADDGDKASHRYRSDSARVQARAIVLATARRHDKELLDTFLRQLVDGREQNDKERRRGIFDDQSTRSEQLLNLALAVVKEDPGEAAKLAERSLADGISFQLQRVLLELRARDKAAADRLFDVALARLATGFQNTSEAQVLASYLFTPGRVFGVGGDRTIALAVSTAAPAAPLRPAVEVDPARARRFLRIMQRILVSLPAPSAAADPALRAQEMVTLARSLKSGFEAYAPDLWLPIEHKLSHVSADLRRAPSADQLPQSVRASLLSRDLPANNEEANRIYVDALEEEAGKESEPIARKLAYAQAALATVPDDLERGTKIAARISEDELRKQVVSFLVYRAALSSLEKGQLDKAVELAAGAVPLQRAVVLITAAQRIGAGRVPEGESTQPGRQRALELLSEAGRLLKGAGHSVDLLRARLGLVVALKRFDTRGALGYLEDVVVDINRAGSFDIVDAGAPRVTGLSDASAHASLPTIQEGYGLKDIFVSLAREDFDESIYVASKLTTPPARGLCMLEIARSILARDAGVK